MGSEARPLTLLPPDARYFPEAGPGGECRIRLDLALREQAERFAALRAMPVEDVLSALFLVLLSRRTGDRLVRLVRESCEGGARTLVEAAVIGAGSFRKLLASLECRPLDPGSEAESLGGILIRFGGAAFPPQEAAADRQLVVDIDVRSAAPHLAAAAPSGDLTRETLRSLLGDAVALLRAVLAAPEEDPLPPTRPVAMPAPPVPLAGDGGEDAATITGAFAACLRFADKLAVEDEFGTRLTYSELDAWSGRLAALLRRSRCGIEDRVALLLDRTAQLPAAMLAVLKAGMAYVPIEADTPRERVLAILAAARVPQVLTQASLRADVPDGPWRIACVDDPELREERDDGLPAPTIAPQNLAYVMHTSGTTGTPKGVMIEHGCVTAFVRGATSLYPLSAEDRFLLYSSSMFDVSAFDVFGALLNGASLYIASADTRHSARRFQELMQRHRITVYMGTPGILEFLDPDALPDLRVMPVGGESMSGEIANAWRRGRSFFNSYGPTETTIAVIAHRCLDDYPVTPPIGVAMPGHGAYILNARLEPLPVGEVGDLYIGGPGVGRGYFGMARETAEAFVPDPFSGRPGARLYRTGDLARQLVSGDIVFLGRADRQVKVRGHRIELGDIEAAMRAAPLVRQAVVAVEDAAHGHRAITAYAVVEDPATADGPAILAFLRQRLPRYMLPHAVHLVERIPLKATGGKTDFEQLKEMVERSLPPAGRAPAASAGRSATEIHLANVIVAPVLGHSRFSDADNLIDHGIDSIQIIRICARVEEEFFTVVEPQLFFDYPSIRQLAELIDRLRTLEHRSPWRNPRDAGS